MKKYLFCFLVGAISIVLSSCDNVAEKKQKEREKAIADSIQHREAFVRDSIAGAEARLLAAKNEEIIKNSKNLFDEEYDEFQDVVWVAPKVRPRNNNANGMYGIIGMRDGEPMCLFFRFQYANDDWLFVKKMIFNIDGENITISPEMKRDNNSKGIWEWCNTRVHLMGDVTESFIKKLANAEDVKVKFFGITYTDVRTVDKKYIKALKETYEYYKALGGTF